MPPEHVISADKLRDVAYRNRATLAELKRIGRFPDAGMEAFGLDVLRVLGRR